MIQFRRKSRMRPRIFIFPSEFYEIFSLYVMNRVVWNERIVKNVAVASVFYRRNVYTYIRE